VQKKQERLHGRHRLAAREPTGAPTGRAKGACLALIDGVPGMIWAPAGQVRVVFDFIISGGKIMAIEMIADPEHLAQLDVVPA
jgi:hypothetical protein